MISYYKDMISNDVRRKLFQKVKSISSNYRTIPYKLYRIMKINYISEITDPLSRLTAKAMRINNFKVGLNFKHHKELI